MAGAMRSCSKALRSLVVNAPPPQLGGALAPLGGAGSVVSSRSYSLFPAIGPHLPPPKEEGAPEGENREEGSSPTSDDFYDLPKGPTHKEMIAARRHYLKRQARRGLLPPSRPIRKPSF